MPKENTRLQKFVHSPCLVTDFCNRLGRVNTREVAFILGFLVGVLVDRIIQVIVDLVFVHHL